MSKRFYNPLKKFQKEKVVLDESELVKKRTQELSGSLTAIIFRRFRKNKAGVLGTIIVLLVFFLAFFAEVLTANLPYVYSSDQLFYYAPLLEPGQKSTDPFSGEQNLHVLGTDRRGRDILTQIVYGSRITLIVAIVSTLIALIIGLPIGLFAGYYGGRVDELLMKVTDLFLTLPFYFVMLAFIAAVQNNDRIARVVERSGIRTEVTFVAIVLGLGLFGWMSIARVVRAEVLKLRDSTFVEAARCLGTPTYLIVFRHMIPNILPPVIVVATYLMANNILAEAALAYLGFTDPSIASWGREISEGQQVFSIAPWISVFSGLAITLAVLGFNLIGDGLRDATDPKLKR